MVQGKSKVPGRRSPLILLMPSGHGGELKSSDTKSMGHKSAKGHNTMNQLASGSIDGQNKVLSGASPLEQAPGTANSDQSSVDDLDSNAGPEPEGAINLEIDPQLAPNAEVSLQHHGRQEHRQDSRSLDQEGRGVAPLPKVIKRRGACHFSSTSSFSTSSSASSVWTHQKRRRKHSRRRSHEENALLQAVVLSLM